MHRPTAVCAALTVLLGGCVPSASVNVSKLTITEMPSEAALNFLGRWKPPAGATTMPINSMFGCGAVGETSIAMKTGVMFPYSKLRLYIPTTGNMTTIRLVDRSSDFSGQWCDFANLAWDTGNPGLHERMMVEISRLATAFGALGVALKTESDGTK